MFFDFEFSILFYRLVPVGAGELRVDGGSGGVGGGGLHVLVAQDLGRELGLRLGQRRARRPVDAVHFSQQHYVSDNAGDEAYGHHQRDDANGYVSFELTDTCDQAARTTVAESDRLYHSYYDLEQEYEEEDHEIERGVAPERLVYRSVPADEAERCEQDEIQYGEAEGREATAREQYGHPTDYVQS